jgi:hypothetical protein
VRESSWRPARSLFAALGLLLLSGSSQAQDVNLLVISHDPSWVAGPQFQRWVEIREEFDWFHEADRGFRVAAVCYPGQDSSWVQGLIAGARAECTGPLNVLILSDDIDESEESPDPWAGIPMRNQDCPEIGDPSPFVPTDDLYADLPPGGSLEVRVGRVPVHSQADAEAFFGNLCTLFWNQSYAREGGPATASDYLGNIDAFVEDADRELRWGAYPAAHAVGLLDRFREPWHTTYLGDGSPDDYTAREALADGRCSRGHQILIAMGTLANRYKLVNMQNVPSGWDVDHLDDNGRLGFLIGLCCDLGNIDAKEYWGRPYVERCLFAPGKGYCGAIVPTRSTREWPDYWFGDELCRRISEGTAAQGHGVTLGRLWIETRNALLEARPGQAIEWRSFLLLGDPTARIVPPPGEVSLASETSGRIGPTLAAGPNPFLRVTVLRCTLPCASSVELCIFDVAGRRLRVLFAGEAGPGSRSVPWDGRDEGGRMVPPGLYFARLRAGGMLRSTAVLRIG